MKSGRGNAATAGGGTSFFAPHHIPGQPKPNIDTAKPAAKQQAAAAKSAAKPAAKRAPHAAAVSTQGPDLGRPLVTTVSIGDDEDDEMEEARPPARPLPFRPSLPALLTRKHRTAPEDLTGVESPSKKMSFDDDASTESSGSNDGSADSSTTSDASADASVDGGVRGI